MAERIARGLGADGKYPGLDAHDPALRPLIDESIELLRSRIQEQGLPLEEISDDVCIPDEYHLG